MNHVFVTQLLGHLHASGRGVLHASGRGVPGVPKGVHTLFKPFQSCQPRANVLEDD